MYHCDVLLHSYIHKLDPFAIQITETLGLRWYGLAYIGGFFTAWVAIRWMGRRNTTLLRPNRVGDFIFACVLGVLVGGRLGYVVFYDPSLLYSFTADFPWWRVLAIQDGGMASHGGIIGVFIATIIWAKKNKIPALHLFDVAALFTTPGLFYGRIANFINGELWGRALPESLQTNPPWWSVKYPTEITQSWLVTPEHFQKQLQGVENLRTEVAGGELFYNTIVTEAYTGNQKVIETITPLLTAWYPSQLFQALTEGPILFCVLFAIWWKPRKPGIIAGWFVVCYGIVRIATEAFRQPDDGVALLFGLSRGQALSVVMILFGVALVLVSARNKVTKIGGFGDEVNSAQRT